jgi:thioesterase domain-containing protein
MMDMVRQEAGEVLGGFSDEEFMLLARIHQNNATIERDHDLGRFDGNALLLVAEQGKSADRPTVECWKPYVSGEVAEIRLPCRHNDMVQPQMLPQVWSAISTWLRLES